MAIARSTLVFIGTDESTGVTIASAASSTGSEVDILGGDAAVGTLHLYLVFTSSVTAGSVDVRFNNRRITAQAYLARSYQWSVPPINGTQMFYLGAVDAPRYGSVDVLNNATGANATNVAVLGQLFKVT